MHRARRTTATARPSLAPGSRRALAWPVLAALALAGAAAPLVTPAHAQTVVGTQQQAELDPPGRVARLNHFDGNVSQQNTGDTGWERAQVNYPLTAGDRLATDASGRAELHLGSTALRLGAGTQMEFAQLDDDRAFLTVMQGTLALRVRQLFQGQHLEVNTPNLAFSITQPGEYRVDVDPAGGITRVASFDGGGVVYGEGGQTLMVGSPQQIRFTGRNLVQVSAGNGVARDAFDQWTLARDRQEDQSQSAQYVSREVVGYQQLDAYGSWSIDPALGPVWYPRVTVADWAPYRYGHWAWVAPWGWTWVDDAPWGFAPSHYGRWTQVGPRWGWVPGPRVARPYYAPALVAFVGGSSGGVDWSLSIGGASQPGVAWFPLAPGEAYRPYYRASNTYITQINRTVIVNNNRGAPPGYRFQRPDSVTAWGADDFRRGRPIRGDFHRVAQADLDRGRPGVIPDLRPPPRVDGNARPGGNDRPWNTGSRPGWQNPQQQPSNDDRRADNRRPGDDRRPDVRPGDGRPDGNRGPDGGPGFSRPPQQAPDLAEQQRRQIERMESRGSLTMEQRQQIQQQHDQQRRALAEQQQQQLQNGAQRQQWEQQQRVQRQQDDQRDRVERQQREMQDRVRRQQFEQQERVRQQQMNMQQQMQQQQQRDRQVQLDQQRAAFEQQQRQQEQQRQAQREQAMQQERAARQQQEDARRQEAQRQREAQQQQQVQRGPQRGGPEGPRPDRPRREDRGDDGRPGRG
ncbi:MAG: chromosome partitioning protein ParA [Burkholderiaceae bacterium]|nr:chromosome partitioning protein ParA [Burkholderiaceae bacterium]